MKNITILSIFSFLIASCFLLLIATYPFIGYPTIKINTFVRLAHTPSLILLFISYLLLLIISAYGIFKANFLKGLYGTGFIIFNSLATLIVIAHQGIPRLFTDIIFLFIGVSAFMGRKTFQKLYIFYLFIFFISSVYTILQLPILNLYLDLPLAKLDSFARPSGFLMINTNASFMAVGLSILDINIKESLADFTNKNLIKFHIITLITVTSSLIFSASRGAILIAFLIVILKRINTLKSIFINLRINKNLLFLTISSSLFLILAFINSDYEETRCYFCKKLFSFDIQNDHSFYARINQFEVLNKIIVNPFKYIFGTNDLSLGDKLGDNPWLEYTFDYGLIYTIMLFLSFLCLFLMCRKFIKIARKKSLEKNILISSNYALLTIFLLMFFYDSPQSIPIYSSLIIFISTTLKSIQLKNKLQEMPTLNTEKL